jgi:hypothetical protein
VSRKHGKDLNYSGMNRPSPVRSGPLVIEHGAHGVQVTMEAALAPPAKSMFADHVQVERSRDGVNLLFGKRDDSNALRSVLEVSFPFKSFITQLHDSVIKQLPHQTEPFIATARRALAEFGYEKIEKLDKLPIGSHAGSIRANAAFFALFEDDAAVDFFHLDAQVLHMLSSESTRGRKVASEIRGIVRVVLSPPVLLYLLERCDVVAEELQKALQSGKTGPQLPQG